MFWRVYVDDEIDAQLLVTTNIGELCLTRPNMSEQRHQHKQQV